MKDSSIVTLLLERSEQALMELKTNYGRLVCSIASHILSHDQDVEECESDTYLAVWNSIPPQRPRELKSYVAKVARNQALKKYSYIHADKRNPNITVCWDELEECVTGDSNNHTGYSESELYDCINDFLELLPKETRKVFVLKYWYFASVKDIMRECGMSKSKVESMLYRTRNKLREFLTERGM